MSPTNLDGFKTLRPNRRRDPWQPGGKYNVEARADRVLAWLLLIAVGSILGLGIGVQLVAWLWAP